eukprot:GHVU01108687.1.p2 GENE.GHVU01108687.1~~GHVU01108687.1.p2  ORF type:complete len:130 (-),score=19.02 GHVU01108687.1:1413-1802(-)
MKLLRRQLLQLLLSTGSAALLLQRQWDADASAPAVVRYEATKKTQKLRGDSSYWNVRQPTFTSSKLAAARTSDDNDHRDDNSDSSGGTTRIGEENRQHFGPARGLNYCTASLGMRKKTASKIFAIPAMR